MLSQEENERLTRVGPGSPMGSLMRHYWIPAAFSHQVPIPDAPPIRVRLLGEDLVLFRDSGGRVGLLEERCPHRAASLFYGRSEENGLRCVYHGLKFDVTGRCVDLPCVPQADAAQREAMQRALSARSYPCIERGDIVWTYMGPPDDLPSFPELEWTLLPASHRYASRHLQECNWLQALEGGFDATHLSFLHTGDLPRNGDVVGRRPRPAHYDVVPTDFGFVAGSGREIGDGNLAWNLTMMMVPFHKLISPAPHGAHVWVPVDDEHTMLYTVEFTPERPFTDDDRVRSMHTENIPGCDRAVQNKHNDYLIDRVLQSSGRSFTGMKGIGIQDCAIQESMGPIADRSREHLLVTDIVIVKVRRLFLQMLQDHAARRDLPGRNAPSYRVRAGRYEAPMGRSLAEALQRDICIAAPESDA